MPCVCDVCGSWCLTGCWHGSRGTWRGDCGLWTRSVHPSCGQVAAVARTRLPVLGSQKDFRGDPPEALHTPGSHKHAAHTHNLPRASEAEAATSRRLPRCLGPEARTSGDRPALPPSRQGPVLTRASLWALAAHAAGRALGGCRWPLTPGQGSAAVLCHHSLGPFLRGNGEGSCWPWTRGLARPCGRGGGWWSAPGRVQLLGRGLEVKPAGCWDFPSNSSAGLGPHR